MADKCIKEFFQKLDNDFYTEDSSKAKEVVPICWQVTLYLLLFVIYILMFILLF